MSIPDARRSGPGVAWRERRTGPRHAAVWVRIGGQWRKGRIIEWVTEQDAPGWDCVILADEPPGGPPWQGRYAYHPASIRRRNQQLLHLMQRCPCHAVVLGWVVLTWGRNLGRRTGIPSPLPPGLRQRRAADLGCLRLSGGALGGFGRWAASGCRAFPRGAAGVCHTLVR